MPQIRFKADPESPAGYYHCSSRVALKEFIFEDQEKDKFVQIMRMYEQFCQVRVLTFAFMSNHAHLAVMVPKRPERGHLPSDRKLVSLVRMVSGELIAATLEQRLEKLRSEAFACSDKGHHPNPQAEAHVLQEIATVRESVLYRMWDISWFMRLVKQRFSIWYNKTHENTGTIWSARFHSVLVEGCGQALASVAAYVDLNPVRAGMEKQPERYRWTGFAAAVAGDRRAIEGIEIIANALERAQGGDRQLFGTEAVERYSIFIYDLGRERKESMAGIVPGRPGIPNDRADEVVSGKCRISMGAAFHHDVRYFTHGGVIGSEQFVDDFFDRNRQHFGPKRKTGARKLRGINSAGLYSIRDLRKNVITPPEPQPISK